MIHNAIIKSTYDWSRSGKFWVECPELDYKSCNVIIKDGLPIFQGNCLQVVYTTPYFENYKSGMIAIPAQNSEILIHYNSRTKVAYYLSTVVAGPVDAGNPKATEEERRRSKSLLDTMEHYQDAAPASMTFKDSQGNGMGTFFKRSNERYINAAILNSEGKKVALDNSPEVDCVKITNGHGDYIKLTGIAESSIPGVVLPQPNRSLEVRTFLNQHFVSDRGELDFKIMDGKEITLENRSSGFFSFGPFLPRSGNINLFSKYKNVNIAAKAPFYVPTELGGSIRLETANSEVVISRTGVTIKMNTGLLQNSRPGQLIAGIGKPQITINGDTGDILIDAGGPHNTPLEGGPSVGGKITLKGRQIELLAPNVVLGAEANITLAAGGAINANAGGVINAAAAGLVNIDGSFVNLNGGGAIAGTAINATVIAEANSYTPEIPVNITPSEYPTGTKYY